MGAGSRGGQGAFAEGVRRPGHPAQLLRRCQPGAGRADHRAGGSRRRAGGVHHRAPLKPRNAEGRGEVSQGAIPQLLRRSGVFQHPHLLRAYLRGEVHHRRHCGRHGSEQPHRLYRVLPDLRRSRIHQCLCAGGADDQPTSADRAAVVLCQGNASGRPAGGRHPGGIQPGRAHPGENVSGLLQLRHLPDERPGRPDPSGNARLGLGQVL